MNLRELYNLMEMIPAAGLNYLATRMVPPNELSKDERKMLADWITKRLKMERAPVFKEILFLLDIANIQWISNPTEEEALKVVYDNPYLIEHIDEPSDNVQMAAINSCASSTMQLGKIFSMITNPCKRAWLTVIADKPSSILTMENAEVEYQMAAITAHPGLIVDKLYNWCPEVRRYAFNINLNYFPQLNDPTEEDCWAALHHDHTLIRYIADPLPEMKAFSILVS